uniref:Myo-inositol-1(Or 4)-monophosphatase n=1 Tax=uncultured prokaryote TaxID=198431 RepID=H5SLG5_9ZZZZ|nr:myo-inositol-1(or 4)-monophosphatase [uncultured prokaryote]
MLEVLRSIALEVGNLLLEHFRRGTATQVVQEKGADDFTLEADRHAQEVALSLLHRHHFGGALLAEETPGGEPLPLGYTPGLLVCLDPLEGTDNFAHRVPLFGTTLAVWREGGWEAVVFYAPALGEVWEAQRGRGAFLNGKPVSHRPGRGLRLAVNQWPDMPPEVVGQALARLLPLTRNLTSTYSDALDLVWAAEGRRSGVVFLYRRAEPWDIAPALIAQEVGLRVTALDGGRWCREEGGVPVVEGGLLVAPPDLHARLLALGLGG